MSRLSYPRLHAGHASANPNPLTPTLIALHHRFLITHRPALTVIPHLLMQHACTQASVAASDVSAGRRAACSYLVHVAIACRSVDDLALAAVPPQLTGNNGRGAAGAVRVRMVDDLKKQQAWMQWGQS